MKSRLAKRIGVILSAAVLGWSSTLVAQPAAAPLGVQGLDQSYPAGIRSRAMGGAGVASVNDASALFMNPAALSGLSTPEIRGGGLFGSLFREQTQEWVPMRPLPGISVLFEGLTGNIKPPDSAGVPGIPVSPWAALQSQYDDIRPNWKRNSSAARLLNLAAAMPLTVADLNIAVGIGVSQMIDLDNYYQNNNSMTPYLGQERPEQVFFTNRKDTVHVKWYQYVRSREGSIYGVTPGFSVEVLPRLTIGASATLLTGTSDDKEIRVERGHLNISINNGVADNFMLDTVYYHQTKVGTSTYSGKLFTFGLLFQQEKYNIGLTIRPAMKLSRSWERNVTSLDTTAKPMPVRIESEVSNEYQEKGKDNVDFPVTYTLGIVVKPTKKWTIAFDYETRNLADVEYNSATGSSSPWVNNKGAMRFGAEYLVNDFLAFRGGYREDIQAFSPDGSALIDKPAQGGVYSAGTGIVLGDVMVELAYEYSRLKYQDIYQSNVNYNTRVQHSLLMELAYRF